MSVDASGIPRYAPPTGEELDEMFAEPTPEEVFTSCSHCTACLRVLELLTRSDDLGTGLDWRKDAAESLECEDCEEYS